MTSVEKKDDGSALGALSENIQFAVDQIQGCETKRVPDADFTLDAFWHKLGMTVKGISAETTKLTLAFSQPPVPSAKDARPLTENIERMVLAMVSAFYALPLSKASVHLVVGRTLMKTTRDHLIEILHCIQGLIQVIETEGCEGSRQQLQSTGGVWEQCDNFVHLPKDNKAAVLRVLGEVQGLVKDAYEELVEAQKSVEDDDEDDEDAEAKWTQNDRKLVAPSVALVKAAQACIKKIQTAIKKNGRCDEEDVAFELDEIADRFHRISPAVDDFALTVYPPMNYESLQSEAIDLASNLQELLQQAKYIHITTEDDANWVEFLLKATQHNLDKIRGIISPQPQG